jgi:hypothetical protein
MADPTRVQVSQSQNELGGDGPGCFNRKHIVGGPFFGDGDAASSKVLDQTEVATIGPVEGKVIQESWDIPSSYVRWLRTGAGQKTKYLHLVAL